MHHLTIMTRWMSSIIGLITTWSAIRLVYWLDHTPTAAGVLEFIIPLVLLPLLASSYAEVNYEGAKIIQVSDGGHNEGLMAIFRASFRLRVECSHSSICMVTRSVLSQLTRADADIMIVKVQMTVYGHAISYGTIGTVVAGILAAFASKILLQEISGI